MLEDYVIPQYNENNQLIAVESITRNHSFTINV